MKHYLIYKITNTVNNKIYIGCHITKNINDDYMGSGVLINRAIAKYGIERFNKEILFECKNKLEMLELETDIVNDEFVARLDTYNITRGGGGDWDYVNRNKLNHKSNQHLIAANKCASDEEYKNAFAKKVSTSLKLYFNSNESWWKGRTHNDSTKKKIGEKNSIHQRGSGNSNYGNVWIYNESLKQSKLIPKQDIELHINDGWKQGRKIKW